MKPNVSTSGLTSGPTSGLASVDPPPSAPPTTPLGSLRAAPVTGKPSLGVRVGVAGLTLGAILTYALVLATGLLRCPLAATFHVPCPTCGATRSTLALLSGDFSGALLNPVAPVLVVLLGGFAFRLVYVAARDGNIRAFDQHRIVRAMLRAFVLTMAVALLVWILRFFGLLGGPVPV